MKEIKAQIKDIIVTNTDMPFIIQVREDKLLIETFYAQDRMEISSMLGTIIIKACKR